MTDRGAVTAVGTEQLPFDRHRHTDRAPGARRPVAAVPCKGSRTRRLRQSAAAHRLAGIDHIDGLGVVASPRASAFPGIRRPPPAAERH